MRIIISALALSAAGIGACSSSIGDSMVGVREDGMEVRCEQEEDEVLTCTPEDGDDECETWEDGGTATILWPPNHKLHRLTLDMCAPARDCDDEDDDGGDVGDDGGDVGDDGGDVGDDGGDVGDDGSDDDDDGVEVQVARAAGDAVPESITSITSDEDVEVGAGGDGHTTDFDMAIVDEVTFELRSERQGGADGRVYRVHYIDTDGEEGSCEFLVPHDHRKPFGGAVDSGTVVTLTP
jgi:hypothetical protein